MSCNKCNKYIVSKDMECRCKSFEIIDENGEEHNPIYAMTAEHAALKYAEKANVDGDYYLMNETVTIEVDGKKFNISAEPNVHYSASEVKDT